MTAQLPADFSAQGRYSKSMASRILGISRTTLDKYIRLGYIGVEINKRTQAIYIKGTSILKFFNS